MGSAADAGVCAASAAAQATVENMATRKARTMYGYLGFKE
jgi:hypothetical protein